VPVIATRVANYVEATQGETAAWLFEPGDPASLGAALAAAAGDPGEVERKATAGRRIVAPLTWEATGSETAALLHRALEPLAGGA
jgi:glycosyltransferase involved in cell wall biosynthesis